MMKHLTTTLFLLVTFNACFAQEKDEKAVRQNFENYKSAILNDKGKEAAEFVDSRTIGYYTAILTKIREADSTEVDALNIIDKLMVFSIRHRATKKEILSFDGNGLFVYAINKGMVGKNSVANNTIGDVSIDGNFAKGQFIANGQETPLYFHFYNENEHWKVDLTSIFPASILAFSRIQEDSEKDENEYLFYLLELITGNKPGNEIWNTIE